MNNNNKKMNSDQRVGEGAGRGGTLFSKFTPWSAQESCSWGCWGTVQVVHLRAPPLIGVAAPSARSANSFPSGPHRKATWSLCHVFFFGCLFYMLLFSQHVVSDSLRPHGLQHARPPCPSPSPGVYSDSCPLSQWCHPTVLSLSPSPPAISLSQHQGLFQWVSSSHQVTKVSKLQHQSFQWIFRTDFL